MILSQLKKVSQVSFYDIFFIFSDVTKVDKYICEMNELKEKLNKGLVMVSDGAWGTMLYEKGLKIGDCPELWNVTHRNEVLDIAKKYIEVGAQMVETNSFGGNSIKLSGFGLEKRAYELNKAAAEISREAAGKDNIVLGSIGPSGKFLITGEITEEELIESFSEQAIALRDGGADVICIETFYALDEAKCAIDAVRNNTDLEIICTFTFDKQMDGSYRTMMGTSPTEMVEFLVENEVDIVGTNCGNGFSGMVDIVKEIRSANSSIPIIVQANAGLPELVNGQSVYHESPDLVALEIPDLIKAGANCIGGCCGTTPEHISRIVEVVKKM